MGSVIDLTISMSNEPDIVSKIENITERLNETLESKTIAELSAKERIDITNLAAERDYIIGLPEYKKEISEYKRNSFKRLGIDFAIGIFGIIISGYSTFLRAKKQGEKEGESSEIEEFDRLYYQVPAYDKRTL